MGGNRGLFLPGLPAFSGGPLELHPTGALGQPLRGDKLFHHIAPKIRVEPCQPLSLGDAALVLPFPHHLGLGIHHPPHIGVVAGGLELVVIELLFRERLGIGQLAPRKPGIVLHPNPALIVFDPNRRVVLILGERADVNGPLGRIILVFLRFFQSYLLSDVSFWAGKRGPGIETYRAPMNRARKALIQAGFQAAKANSPAAFSAYSRAGVSAAHFRRRPPNRTPFSPPAQRAARRRHKAAGRGPGRPSARPPAPDLRGAPPPGSICNRPPSSISPAYSTRSRGADSRIPGHSWRTILSQGSGWPPFPHGSAHAKHHLPPGLPKRD